MAASRKLLLLLSIALLMSVAGGIAQRARTDVIPKDTWVDIYFDEINRVADQAHIKSLRSASIEPGDVEFRLWAGFGLTRLRGYILKRQKGVWSARSIANQSDRSSKVVQEPASKDWNLIWASLEAGGVRDIADRPRGFPSCSVSVLDGIGYVAEIADTERYRTYLVDNPVAIRSSDGDRFLRLLAVLYHAFGQGTQYEIPDLADGETRILGTVTDDPPSQFRALVSSWTSTPGKAVVAPADLQLSAADALAQGRGLNVESCPYLPGVQSFARGELPMYTGALDLPADVSVEIKIEADGHVSAARVIAGHLTLRQDTTRQALDWTFGPFTDGRTRSAVLTVKYRRERVSYPWLKHQ